MDRKKQPKAPGRLAEAGAFASDVKKPIGAHPRSEITGRHDAGSGANETIDGLNSLDEATRRAAEDIPLGTADGEKDLPVFDRGNALPKV